MLSFTDTLSGKKVAFAPRDPGRAGIYWCGPTVYDHPHLGHARNALGYDILHRYLEWRGYAVTLVSNITDIDDKIIQRAASEGRPEHEVATEYERSYIDQMNRLGIQAPDLRPRATEYVPQMIDVITLLIDRGYAYAVEGSGVYFDVDRLDDYGALVHRDVHELREGVGARVDVDERKDDPLDFALWKSAKPGEPAWPSPWGPGRPGWHIECVAMALQLLGADFDIHGGGDDLVFPHHENERAEASGTGQPFARTWIHNGMVQVSGEKMSKSLGNFTTLAEVLERYDARALRLLILQTHYRKTMEINRAALDQSAAAIGRLDAMARRAIAAGIDLEAQVFVDELVGEFRDAMDDDLGTPSAVAVIFDALRQANAALDGSDLVGARALGATVAELAGVLGLTLDPGGSDGDDDDDEISALVEARQAARAGRDFAEADRLRDVLTERGIVIEDTPSGPVWRRA
ncbi:MAG TPA: cysteine--tRNA ligase [Acidimicrobiales bacterium]|nr:cysteine--tRNA ligase [Acidimicrobiales bacterium]